MTGFALSSDDLLARLHEAVGESQVITDPVLMDQYVVDWSRRFSGPALAVVRPGTTAEVALVMRACAASASAAPADR